MSMHTVPTPPPAEADAASVAPCEPVTRQPGEKRTRVTDTVRAYVYDRDARTCQRCGTGPLITTTERVGELSAARYLTLDHVIEWSAGGCDHAHNLRVMCSACNPSIANRGRRR